MGKGGGREGEREGGREGGKEEEMEKEEKGPEGRKGGREGEKNVRHQRTLFHLDFFFFFLFFFFLIKQNEKPQEIKGSVYFLSSLPGFFLSSISSFPLLFPRECRQKLL